MSGDRQQKIDPELRVKAIESLLMEKGELPDGAIDRVVSAYENDIGPMNGARVVARAWIDEAYRSRLLSDAPAAIDELGFLGTGTHALRVVENTPETHNVIVCTLCSCYPWSLLGLPPQWYKSEAYRSRLVSEPREVLADFGLELDDSIEIRVWDSSSDARYMVLPTPPPDIEDLAEHELAARVTREMMVGVAREAS